jgi:hypothetical protein
MTMLEPKPPRKPTFDYHVLALPEEIFAIVRVTWYRDGKADEVDQVVLMEDGDNSLDAFTALVSASLRQGANVSVQSGYQPQDLGIVP